MIRIMNKKKILAVVMLLTVFSSVFAFAPSKAQMTIVDAPAQTVSEDNEALDSSPNALGDPLGGKGIWAQEANMSLFTADGNLTDWAGTGVQSEIFNGIEVWLAYDNVSVYVGLKWTDATLDNTVGNWTKTAEDTWEFIAGADDMVTVGFSDGTDSDYWVWTASNRTADDYALEIDAAGAPDGGTVPFEANSNVTDPAAAIDGTAFQAPAKPLYDESWTPISNYSAIPVNTSYYAWKTTPTAPTGNQTQVGVGWYYSGTEYMVEMTRALDPGATDDFAIDFTGDLDFVIGGANAQDTSSLLIATEAYSVGTTNEPAQLVLDDIPDTITESFFVSGQIWDDYGPTDTTQWTVEINTTGWDAVYDPAQNWWEADLGAKPKYKDFIFIPPSGEWSYFMKYPVTVSSAYEWYGVGFAIVNDLPLMTQTVYVTYEAKYDGPMVVSDTFTVVDSTAPEISQMVNITDRYGGAVPYGEDVVNFAATLSDNHDLTNNLSVSLWYYKEDEVPSTEPMVVEGIAGSIFNTNVTIEHSETPGEYYNYTYFVEAWDTSLNKATSSYMWFLSEPKVVISSATPGFGIIAGLFGTAIVALLLRKKLK